MKVYKVVLSFACMGLVGSAVVLKAAKSSPAMKKDELIRRNIGRIMGDPVSFVNLDLSETDLAGLDLALLDFSRSNFSDATLTGIDLEGSNLKRAIFTGAILRNANLSDAKMMGAIFTSADLTGAIYSAGTDVKGAKGLTLAQKCAMQKAYVKNIPWAGGEGPDSCPD